MENTKWLKSFDEWGQVIICPKCGSNYVHFEEPISIFTDDYKAWDGRGAAIKIPMWCEEDHQWTLRIGFHKGHTYIKNEDIKNRY